MKRIVFVLSLLLSVSQVTLAQKSKAILIPVEDDGVTPVVFGPVDKKRYIQSNIPEAMKLTYTKPKKFKLGSYECFKDYPKLEMTFTCMGSQIRSTDGQFIAFLITHKIFTKDFQRSLESLFPGRSYNHVDKKHFIQARGIFRNYYGNQVVESWRDSVVYYSDADAKSKFNADTAFHFTIALRPEDYYKKKFKYVAVLFMQRKGRGYAYICCFYTDKAKARFEKYWSKIEGTLRYED